MENATQSFLTVISEAEFQKDENVWDPNLGMKMSDFHISVNISRNKEDFLIKTCFKALFIHLWSIAIKFHFQQENK